jgi:hypothetical protein
VAVDDTTVHGQAWLRKHLQSPDATLHETVERLSVATSGFANDTWLRCMGVTAAAPRECWRCALRDHRVLEHDVRRSVAQLLLLAIAHASGLAAVLEATPQTVPVVSLDAHP